MREAVSITSNIAEGFGRKHFKEKHQFYSQAHGSLLELQSQLIVAKDIGYLPVRNFSDIMFQSELAYSQLQGLLRATKDRC